MLSVTTLIGIAVFATILLVGCSLLLGVVAIVLWRRSSRTSFTELVASPLKVATDDEDDAEVEDVKTIFKTYRREKRLANVKELMAEACSPKKA